MNSAQQRIVIAEACGWNKQTDETGFTVSMIHSNGKVVTHANDLPDYLNDLNAMHEAEKVCQKIMHDRQDDYAYFDCLIRIVKHNFPVSATAAQRAEAFLRTLNLWSDD